MVTKPSHNLRREHKWLKETATLQEDKDFVFQAIQKHIANKRPKTNSPPTTPSKDECGPGTTNFITSIPASGPTNTATKQHEVMQTLSNDTEWLSYPAIRINMLTYPWLIYQPAQVLYRTQDAQWLENSQFQYFSTAHG